ncbi:MAG: hypothetical protein MZW92_04035 [Comamonadaceae bacterium]|nr:hypothetical protein [Comamonadaceae bacterium]
MLLGFRGVQRLALVRAASRPAAGRRRVRTSSSRPCRRATPRRSQDELAGTTDRALRTHRVRRRWRALQAAKVNAEAGDCADARRAAALGDRQVAATTS